MSKKKTIFISILLGVFLMCIGAYIGVDIYNHTPKRLYERNWKITLPKKMNQEFDISTEPSFHGDGVRFSVFSSKSEISNEFLTGFKTEDIECFKEEIYKYLEMLKVPNEYYPNFEHPCSMKKMEMYSNKLYLIYDEKTYNLYVVQWLQ